MSSLRTLPIYQSPIQTQPTASQYKSSLYNIFVEKETEVYAFNSRSVALSRLTKREYAAVRRMLDGDLDTGGNPELESLRQGLIKGQFLIPQTLDEIEMLKVKNRLTRFSSGGLGLIIAPTLRCNFACEYCYVDLNANKMDAESRARVKKFFDYKLNPNSAVSVVWTGGDPSLAMDVVEEISSYFAKKCEEKNSKYDTYLITNGYLLDDEMRSALRNGKIDRMQISIDGNRELHDRTRCLAGGKPTYDRILENVEESCDEFRILLRINVDGVNKNYIPELLDDLKARGLNHRLSIYFAHVDDVNRNSKDYHDRCLTAREYAAIEVGLFREAYARGFAFGNRQFTQPVGQFCGANSQNYFVIDSKAQLLKCYHDFGSAETEGIGHIGEDGREVITLPQNLFKWLGWDPFEIDECRDCKVLPVCMGGCSHKIMNHNMEVEKGCLKMRFTVEEMIDIYVDRAAKGEPQSYGCSGCAVTDATNV